MHRKVPSSGAHWPVLWHGGRREGSLVSKWPLLSSAGYSGAQTSYLLLGHTQRPLTVLTAVIPLPGLGSRGSSWAGLALLTITYALEGHPMTFQKGLHTDGYSLIPVTALTRCPAPVVQSKYAWLLSRPCWGKRGQLSP